MVEAHKSEKVELKYKIEKLQKEMEDIRMHKVSSLGTQRETIANVEAQLQLRNQQLKDKQGTVDELQKKLEQSSN